MAKDMRPDARLNRAIKERKEHPELSIATGIVHFRETVAPHNASRAGEKKWKEMDARDKAYMGATAAFDAPNRPGFPTDREYEIGLQVLRILDKCTDEEFATVLMSCIMVLGDRLAEKRKAKK